MDDPTIYEEVLRRPDIDHLMQAINEELRLLKENKTWVLADLPEGRKAIWNKWAFKAKRDHNETIQRYKVQLVFKGCSRSLLSRDAVSGDPVPHGAAGETRLGYRPEGCRHSVLTKGAE